MSIQDHPGAGPRFAVLRAAEEIELIAFLAKRLKRTRRAAKRLLDERCVFVDGRRVWMARHRVHPGQSVEVRPAGPGRVKPPRLLAETPTALVVDKPPGLLSNEGEESVEVLLQTLRGEPDLRVVHRLDRDTSGCLWLARTLGAHREAVSAFRAGRVWKEYEAIVLGCYPNPRDRIDAPVEGRRALTHVERLAVGPQASRLRLRIETGRTHQIRRHLLAAGTPVAGDRAYGTSRRLPEAFRDLPRHLLHAVSMEARGADGRLLIRARAPLPADYRAALRRFGLVRPAS